MKRKILIVVTSDPRTSARTAEAVRIAAGVGTWERAEIALYLRGEAVRALSESAEDLLNGGDYARYWPMLQEAGQQVYVQKGAVGLGGLAGALPYQEISDEQLAGLAAEQNTVLHF